MSELHNLIRMFQLFCARKGYATTHDARLEIGVNGNISLYFNGATKPFVVFTEPYEALLYFRKKELSQ